MQWPPTQEVLPPIPWSRIEDRHGESALEHSFLCDEENERRVKVGHGWGQGSDHDIEGENKGVVGRAIRRVMPVPREGDASI